MDPTDTVRLPRRRRADAAMSIPTPEEVGLLMAVAEEQARTFIALCAFAGLRLGEAAAVQLNDVNFVRKTLNVTRQVQRVTGGAIDVRSPKYGSERVVHLADGLIDLVAQHVADIGTVGAEQWLFGEDGEPPHQNTVGYWWRKALQAAGLSGIKLHDPRHFYASGLLAAGCDVVTVQRSLGHAKATTTLNTYAHLWPTAEDRTRAAAQSIIEASLGDQSTADGPDRHSPTHDEARRIQPSAMVAGPTTFPQIASEDGRKASSREQSQERQLCTAPGSVRAGIQHQWRHRQVSSQWEGPGKFERAPGGPITPWHDSGYNRATAESWSRNGPAKD
ncbi:tyrosine-type recombinase/integrase [Aeromicrobium sp. S22]|uniref:site-specific integrase n=1 Tax=Aeromicrobium sp. S22 TaxID=2662029 RepID=UPI00129E4FDB|nr:site-specific integrase [Aeromicrobium sp. S22]MRK00952.1 tyrosine-type recombinase/integrase [Aeromicrobium sp. S22]